MDRVLVTGSRSWKDIQKVYDVLYDYYEERGPFVLVHGNCKEGADNFAHQWFVYCGEELDCVEEKHDADWRPQGRTGPLDRSAGIKRNHLMVMLGADICFAFPTECFKKQKNCPPGRHYSHGTADCMKTARAAEIPVSSYGPSLTD